MRGGQIIEGELVKGREGSDSSNNRNSHKRSKVLRNYMEEVSI